MEIPAEQLAAFDALGLSAMRIYVSQWSGEMQRWAIQWIAHREEEERVRMDSERAVDRATALSAKRAAWIAAMAAIIAAIAAIIAIGPVLKSWLHM
ncbi:MAG TPA: hypothetical protein VMS78_15350 [Rhizomicrobium sp.]|nr:hypothetical protein [Rhizomicrobium sp.]